MAKAELRIFERFPRQSPWKSLRWTAQHHFKWEREILKVGREPEVCRTLALQRIVMVQYQTYLLVQDTRCAFGDPVLTFLR